MKEVIYGCLRGLDVRITDCKLGMHAKCFDEIQRSTIHDIWSRHNCGRKQLKKLNNCCHHSLRDLYVHTDGAWWKMKNISTEKILATIMISVSYV